MRGYYFFMPHSNSFLAIPFKTFFKLTTEGVLHFPFKKKLYCWITTQFVDGQQHIYFL